MSTPTVIQHYLDKFGTMANTMSDISFDNLSFLSAKEPVYGLKGQKQSKSYYEKSGKEAVRIVYNRIIGDYTYNGTTYNDVFLGLSKTVLFFDLAGEIAYPKSLQPYYFELEPVFVGDGTFTVTGFSSPKMRSILREERSKADDFLQAKNPQMYAFLNSVYGSLYDAYMRTGDSSAFVAAMNSESNEEVLAVLNTEVAGMEPLTVKELIILNLQ